MPSSRSVRWRWAMAPSSKSSISASLDSAQRAVAPVPEFDFTAVSKDADYMKELGGVEDSGTSPELTGSVGSAEALIGLKLGKMTYYEDVCNANTVKAASFPAPPVPSNDSVKKSSVSHQTVQITRCLVEGCNVDLFTAKDYHRKHRVCENHSKFPKVVVAGQERRFCQQCSRFHDLSQFDQKKRSCRRRLADHNARRRKLPPCTISFDATRLSSPFYDDRQHMNLLLNRSPFGHMRSVNSTWESSCDFKLTQAKGPWTSSNKTGGIGGQLYLPSNELSTAASTFRPDLDRLLPFKSTTAEVLSQDDRQQMNLLLNRSPFGHMRPVNSTWESSCDFKLTQAKGPWTSSNKTGGNGGQLYLPSNELSTAASTFRPDLDGLLPFKSTTAEVLSQDDRQQMNLLLNRSPFGHTRSANSTWESSCDFKLTQAKGPWTSSKKTGGIGGQLYLPSSELSTTVSTFHPDLDGLLPFKSTTAEVLSQGLEASVIASNLDGASDLQHAYSLLSADSCCSSDPRTTSSINQLTHVNSTSAAQSGIHVMHPSSDYWQAEQPLAQETRAFPFTLHSNGSHFQEFQLLKTPYETGFFDSNQIH